jgi:hypothetical protein
MTRVHMQARISRREKLCPSSGFENGPGEARTPYVRTHFLYEHDSNNRRNDVWGA